MRDNFFNAIGKLVYKRPYLVIGVALLLVTISLVITELSGIKMETRVLDLMPKDDPAAIEYNKILKGYDSASQIIIAVKGGSKKDKIDFIEKAAKKIKDVKYKNKESGKFYPFVKRVVIKQQTDFIKKHGLMLQKRSDLENSLTLFNNLEAAQFLQSFNDFLEMEYIEDSGAVTQREKEDSAINGLKGIMSWLKGVKGAKDNKITKENAMDAASALSIGEQYMFSEDNSMLMAMVVPAISMDEMESIMNGAKNLRTEVDKIAKDYPELKVGYTGMAMLSLEEMETTQSDMGISTLLSLIFILALFVWAFKMKAAPVMAIINLILGILLTVGFIAITFGRVNIMTGMFAVILLGLGIDFAIHLNAAYSTARGDGKTIFDAVKYMFLKSGQGVVTGALTTATAFLALALTGLDAFIELGVVLAAGLLFTLLSSLFVLPAMYIVNDKIRTRKKGDKPVKKPGLDIPFLEKIGNAMKKKSVSIAVLTLFSLLTGFFVYTAMNAKFEADMLKMEPVDMPAVLTHHEILKNFEINPDFAMVTTDSFDKSRKISDRLKDNRLVGMVDSITEYLPSADKQKKRKPVIDKIRQNAERYLVMNIQGGMPTGAIADIPEYLTQKSVNKDDVNLFLDEIDRLQMNVEEIDQIAFMGMQNRLRRYCDKLTGGKDKSKSEIMALKKEFKNNSKIGESIAVWQQNYIPFLAQNLIDMSSTDTITIKTLPKNIIDQYMNKAGDNLVTIYAAVDLWNGNKMNLFQKATNAISENVTGTVILMDRLISLIGSKGMEATLFSLLAVFIILLIDFKNLWQALFATVPLIVGFIWMIGIFAFLGFKFDAANVTAIPLILGIGIDDAVHIMHGIKREGVNRLGLIYKQTGRALILTSITTGVAFGSIAFANHRGLAGMGILLFIGVISCLLASLFVLPAIISLFFNKRVNTIELEEE